MTNTTPGTPSHELRCQLDLPVVRKIVVGRGIAVQLRGWVYSPAARIRKLEVIAAGVTYTVHNHSWVRRDVFDAVFPHEDPAGHSLFSEFVLVLPIEEIQEPETRELFIRATLVNGHRTAPARLGELVLVPNLDIAPTEVIWPGNGSKVAISMATYNPDETAFAEQVQSIREQEHTNWVVIVTDDSSTKSGRDVVRRVIGDDPRFYYFANKKRQGFYRNFEGAIARAPVDADFVALSDQDDRWYKEKIRTLLETIGNRAMVFSDCRIVRGREVLAETFWTYRENTYDNLSMLFIANSVTGAACMFRRDLIPSVVPFPEPLNSYHDQWLAIVASVNGGISYVDKPLYDYVQHGANAVGHTYVAPFAGAGTALRRLYRAYRAKHGLLAAGNVLLHEAWNEFPKIVQKAVLAATLDLRHPTLASADKRVVVQMQHYYTSFFEAVRQKVLAAYQRRSSLNAEGLLLWAATGLRIRNAYYRWKGGAVIKAVTSSRREAQLRPTSMTDAVLSAGGDNSPVHWIFHNLKPLKLKILTSQPRRINVILATIDFRYIFGGYIGMFNFALRLKREGFDVRIILTEMTDFNPDRWAQELQKYPGITTLLDDVEIIYCFDREVEVPVSPTDRFVATNCWAAHLAHKAHEQLGAGRFMFMVQEYEPYFLPMNSISALFQQSYTFPQFDLFSTAHLRDFFAQERIGLFSTADSEQFHAVFSNAIQKFTPRLEDMVDRERRILFYARPEAHAARNMFELGMKALMDLANSPDLDLRNWKFYGMGSLGGVRTMSLAPGINIELMPKTDLQTYTERMTKHDVGLSLMLTPHPSLVPLEMASAGMWTVTNTFANKTAESLTSISNNIIATQPTLEDIVSGLKVAISRADLYQQRLAGSKINWPSDWESAFPTESIKKVTGFLRN